MPPKPNRQQTRPSLLALFPSLHAALRTQIRVPATMTKLLFHRRMNGGSESATPKYTFRPLPSSSSATTNNNNNRPPLTITAISMYVLERELDISHAEWLQLGYKVDSAVFVVSAAAGAGEAFVPGILVRDAERNEGVTEYRVWREGGFGQGWEVQKREYVGGEEVAAAAVASFVAPAGVVAAPVVPAAAAVVEVPAAVQREGEDEDEDEDEGVVFLEGEPVEEGGSICGQWGGFWM